MMRVEDNLQTVAARLRAGRPELLAGMRAGLRAAVAPAEPAIRRSARSTLPRGGGANDWVAGADIAIRVTLSPRTTQVTLTMSQPNSAVRGKRSQARAAGNLGAAKAFSRASGHDLRSINAGRLRHPLYGNTDYWFDTAVTPGFFTTPLQAMRPEITAAMQAVALTTAHAAGFTLAGSLL